MTTLRQVCTVSRYMMCSYMTRLMNNSSNILRTFPSAILMMCGSSTIRMELRQSEGTKIRHTSWKRFYRLVVIVGFKVDVEEPSYFRKGKIRVGFGPRVEWMSKRYIHGHNRIKTERGWLCRGAFWGGRIKRLALSKCIFHFIWLGVGIALILASPTGNFYDCVVKFIKRLRKHWLYFSAILVIAHRIRISIADFLVLFANKVIESGITCAHYLQTHGEIPYYLNCPGKSGIARGNIINIGQKRQNQVESLFIGAVLRNFAEISAQRSILTIRTIRKVCSVYSLNPALALFMSYVLVLR